MKNYIYNPTTVYIDPNEIVSNCMEIDTSLLVVPEKIEQFVDDGKPVPVPPHPDPSPGPGPDPSPGPTPPDPSYNPYDDPSNFLYDGDKNGVPDYIDNMDAEREVIKENQMWDVI